jgi:hypothetical protein
MCVGMARAELAARILSLESHFQEKSSYLPEQSRHRVLQRPLLKRLETTSSFGESSHTRMGSGTVDLRASATSTSLKRTLDQTRQRSLSPANSPNCMNTETMPIEAAPGGLMLAVPPSDDHERRPVAGSRVSAIVLGRAWCAPGAALSVPTRGRTGRSNRARLSGAGTAPWRVSAERHQALEILAGSSLGCTEAMSAPGERRHPSAGDGGGY